LICKILCHLSLIVLSLWERQPAFCQEMVRRIAVAIPAIEAAKLKHGGVTDIVGSSGREKSPFFDEDSLLFEEGGRTPSGWDRLTPQLISRESPPTAGAETALAITWQQGMVDAANDLPRFVGCGQGRDGEPPGKINITQKRDSIPCLTVRSSTGTGSEAPLKVGQRPDEFPDETAFRKNV